MTTSSIGFHDMSESVLNGDHCRDLVYRHDRDRYLAALFAPEQHRHALMTLYAFDVEINNISSMVSDPMPGEIRLQWWSDAIGNVEHGSIEGHPVAAALRSVVESYNLPTQPLLNLIEAHRFDLYNDPMPTLLDLEGYAGETVSALLQLGAIVLAGGRDPGTADVSGHAGAALGIARTLRLLPVHTAKRQVFLPTDVLARHGLTPQEVLHPGNEDRVAAAVAEMCIHVRHHLDRFTKALEQARCGSVASVYLQTGLLPAFLKKLQKSKGDPRKTVVEISQWRRQLSLWRTARRLMG